MKPTCMHPQIIRQSERSLSQKATHGMITPMLNVRRGKVTATADRWSPEAGSGRAGSDCRGHRVLDGTTRSLSEKGLGCTCSWVRPGWKWGDENVLELEGGDRCLVRPGPGPTEGQLPPQGQERSPCPQPTPGHLHLHPSFLLLWKRVPSLQPLLRHLMGILESQDMESDPRNTLTATRNTTAKGVSQSMAGIFFFLKGMGT